MRYIKWLCIVGLLLITVACEKEIPVSRNLKEIQFNARIEPLSGVGNTKVYLYNEQWVFWEIGDKISIGSNLSTEDGVTPAEGDLVNAAPGSEFDEANFNGVFLAALPENSSKFLGLHPVNAGNRIKGKSTAPYFEHPRIVLPAVQPRRPGEREDLSFAKQIYPMVAWFGGEWDEEHPVPYNLDFRSLGCLVRIQLYNSSTSDAVIDNIVFTSRAGSDCPQLCGPFSVTNFNVAEPYLTSTTPSDNEVSLTFGDDGMEFKQDSLRTFYLVLPAVNDNGHTTTFKLAMTVNAKVDGVNKTFTKNFSASTRRTGITNMRAIGITDWASTPATTVGLAGCGTKERPFKIYTVDDLVYLRSCYNSVDRKINGQPITENTYINVMRSDIVLNTSNWTSSSISNFVGHFVDVTSVADHGITNNSNIAIFQDVAATGHVENLVVKSGASLTASAVALSPLCNINRGEIKNCRLKGSVSASVSDLGGIVGINRDGGLVTGCACEANMTVASGKRVGGICFQNITNGSQESVISGCYVTSTSSLNVSASEAAGICYSNEGTVKDCYFSATVALSSAKWGGIVYRNGTAVSKVKHCYNNGFLNTTGTVGGIVHTLANGSVDYCWLAGYLKGSQAGGIIHTVSGGSAINCYVDNFDAQVFVNTSGGGTYIGGGVVATVSGGEVKNSYAHTVNIIGSGAILGGFVGTLTGGVVSNCYAYVSHTNNFYGSTSLSGAALTAALGGSAPCYLVAGSQTGVTTKANGDFSAILNADGHLPVGGVSWSGIPPVLGAYVP